MTETVHTNAEAEYEDDFEKDLDWLISEEDRSEDQDSSYDDIEAEIDRELERDEKLLQGKTKEKKWKGSEDEEEDEEKWPPPMEPLEYDSDRDSPFKSVPPPLDLNEQTDEEKKYILEKIEQANRELQEQETPDMTRQRRLHFKEKLVDLVVPPFSFKTAGDGTEIEEDGDPGVDADVSKKMSDLKLSLRDESGRIERSSENGGSGVKESRVLVEKDGKFDLVSMKDVESQSFFPPIANSNSNGSHISSNSQQNSTNPRKSHSSPSTPARPGTGSSRNHSGHFQAPRPPSQPRVRPSSANHRQADNQKRNSKRRVQSATGTPSQGTFILSPQQKEQLQRLQERRDRLAKEAEQKKREEEEMKRQENEQAFKAWMLRKKEQLQEEKRIQRAQEIERMNCKGESADPEEAFRFWLQRKQAQQQKERKLVKMRRLEEDSGYLLHSREECERAFKHWLRRKRAEKAAEQHAAREHSRRLAQEERRMRRKRDLMCTMNETKPFRFTEQLAYEF